jgi:probable HAF family extracellular repeat protein
MDILFVLMYDERLQKGNFSMLRRPITATGYLNAARMRIESCLMKKKSTENHREPQRTIKNYKEPKRTKKRESHIGVIAVSLAIIISLSNVAHSASPTVTYKVVDFGAVDQTLGEVVRGPDSADGVIGGSASFGFGARAFLLTNTSFENLEGLPGTDRSAAHGSNEHGAIVGSSNTATSLRAFVWTRKDGSRDLGALPGDSGSEAFGINSHNDVVGYSSGPRGIQAVLWTADGKIQGLGRLRSGDHSRAVAINELGEVIGNSGISSGTTAFLWTRKGGMVSLGTLPGDTDSMAVSINRQGQVVGYSIGPSGTQAFLWTRKGGMVGLGTLSGHDYSRALSINDAGDVVGLSGTHSRARAFFWTSSRGMEDLNSLIAMGSDFVLAEAVGINNRGTVLTIGRDDDSHADAHDNHELPARVILLVPVR